MGGNKNKKRQSILSQIEQDLTLHGEGEEDALSKRTSVVRRIKAG